MSKKLKEDYTTPVIEILTVNLEHGFAASGWGNEDYGDGNPINWD